MNKTAVITLCIMGSLLLCAFAITYFVLKSPSDARNSDALKALATTKTQVFTDLEGNPLHLDAYEGKVRVINTWASWSPFSANELPLLNELASAYKDKNVVVIAVNRKEPKEQAKNFLESIQAFEHLIFAIDTFDSFYASVGGYSMPETIFYDADGNMTFHKRGSMTKEEMERYTNEAIKASL